eukprot:2879492-Ditylum_brightwellii.AAC.1
MLKELNEKSLEPENGAAMNLRPDFLNKFRDKLQCMSAFVCEPKMAILQSDLLLACTTSKVLSDIICSKDTDVPALVEP